MRIIDKLTNEQFNGDRMAAIEYMYRNFGSQKNDYMDKFFNELNQEELQMASEVVKKTAIERSGKKAVDKLFKLANNADFLELSPEEIKNAEKNPYKAKVGKDLLKLLLINGGLLAICGLAPQLGSGAALEKIATSIASILTINVGLKFGPNIINYFKFKNAQNQIDYLENFESKTNEGVKKL